jgi:predicted transcriptional regulator
VTDRDDALQEDLDLQVWQDAGIREALEASKAGEEPIAHERMVAWLKSWGTDHELPPPDLHE